MYVQLGVKISMQLWAVVSTLLRYHLHALVRILTFEFLQFAGVVAKSQLVCKFGCVGVLFGSSCHLVYIIILKWWSCVKSNKRGRVSALLGHHQHALARM